MLRLVSLLCAVLVAAAALVTSAAAARVPVTTPAKPVPSLTPDATAKLWEALVSRPYSFRFATAACTPARVIFYSPTDWLRLATKLAATSSPCAQYYVSVPPLAADKAQLRGDQAWRIRALGPNFHALAEINVTGWSSWVATTGNGWYAAGVEARRRMAAAGFDVSAGDTWALNELSSAVRIGTGSARANLRAFLSGLLEGEGGAAVRGVVWTVGIGQGTSELSVYQSRLQDWYEDGGFWTDVGRATSDWSQEVYGDARNYAAAGTTRDQRRDALNEYLQHQAALAAAAPSSAASVRSLLAAANAPLANAAWQYDASFGWTNVPVELMQDYVSAQTYALRSAGIGRFGFAWSPRSPVGMSTTDFNLQTDALLARLASAIADSDEAPAGACGTEWCNRDLDGAGLTTAWRTFASWKPSRLAFTSAPQTLAPGAASTPVTVQSQTSTGVAYTAGVPVAVTFASSSSSGSFSTSAAGPWTTTVVGEIVSGASDISVYYRDSQAGTPTITASASGRVAATQVETIPAVAEPPSQPQPQPQPQPPPSAPAPAPAPAPAAGTTPEPANAEPGNDNVSVTTTVAAQPVVPGVRRLAPLRALAPARLFRSRGVATIRARFAVSEPARLAVRLTPARSTRPLSLLRGSSVAGRTAPRATPTLLASASRAGSYTVVARVAGRSLARGRTYLLRLTARDAAGVRRDLTIRVPA